MTNGEPSEPNESAVGKRSRLGISQLGNIKLAISENLNYPTNITDSGNSPGVGG
jgi:hypothetical protein